MNRLSTDERAKVVSCLVEGCSQRATTRMTGVAKKTVARLAMEIGEACEKFAETALVNLPCQRIQCDEIWAFVGCKGKNASTEDREERGFGDVWTWVALDPDTKLAAGWFVGDRSASAAYSLLRPLQKRLANKVQLTTDVHQTLRVTPAMQAGLSDHVWSLAELVGLLDAPMALAA